jgi:hypothetical protein
MSEAIAPVVWTLACLLVVAGAAKLRSPGPAALALRGAGVAAGPLTVRLASGAEVAIGVWALAVPCTASMAALATAYLVFAGAIARMRTAAVADCGCFGAGSFAPGRFHEALDLAAVGAATVAVAVPPAAAVLERPPLEALALAAGVACAAVLLYALFTMFPRAWDSYRPSQEAR